MGGKGEEISEMGAILKGRGRQLADFMAGLWEAVWGLRHETGGTALGVVAPKTPLGQDDRRHLTGDRGTPADSRSSPPDRDAETKPPVDGGGARVRGPALVFDREADPTGDALAAEMAELSFSIRFSIRSDASVVRKTDWAPLFRMLPDLLDSGEASPFPRNKPGPSGSIDPFVGWDGVLARSCEQIWWVLLNEDLAQPVAKEHGDLIVRLARLTFAAASERPPASTAKDLASGEARVVHTMAMRVNALRMLRAFLHQKRQLGAQEVLSGDARSLLEDFIDGEDHCVPMAHLGNWVPFLHEYDPHWTVRHLPKIFPERADRRDLFVAAWTGYLHAPLPDAKMFTVPEVRELYRRGLALDRRQDKPHNPRQYTDYELGIAEHFALACMEHENFGPEDPLLMEFLGRRDTRQLREFVEVVGKRVCRREPRTTDHMRRCLPAIWEWMLENCDEPSLFAEFGDWMAMHAGLMDTATLARLARRTLRKSGGSLWMFHSLMDSVVELTRAAPEEMREVIDLFMGSDITEDDFAFGHIRDDGGWLEATRILLACDDMGEQERARFREIERMLQPDGGAPAARRTAPRAPDLTEGSTRAA